MKKRRIDIYTLLWRLETRERNFEINLLETTFETLAWFPSQNCLVSRFYKRGNSFAAKARLLKESVFKKKEIFQTLYEISHSLSSNERRTL